MEKLDKDMKKQQEDGSNQIGSIRDTLTKLNDTFSKNTQEINIRLEKENKDLKCQIEKEIKKEEESWKKEAQQIVDKLNKEKQELEHIFTDGEKTVTHQIEKYRDIL